MYPVAQIREVGYDALEIDDVRLKVVQAPIAGALVVRAEVEAEGGEAVACKPTGERRVIDLVLSRVS